jgi:hypothetical protein
MHISHTKNSANKIFFNIKHTKKCNSKMPEMHNPLVGTNIGW